MRELALIGLVALAFGVGSAYATGELGPFGVANLAVGAVALPVALALSAGRLRRASGPYARPLVLRGLAGIALALVGAVALERAAARSGVELDWTREGRFELSPATLEACAALSEPRATLFYDALDPRVRRTRLLLATLARRCPLALREALVESEPADAERFGVASSNSVVLEAGGRFETIARPTEGALYEGLYRLRSTFSGVVTVLRGDGEGDVDSPAETGFSGLAAALETEGYRLRRAVSAALAEVPRPTDALLVLAPERRLPTASLAALRAYLEGGGRLVALLEPGRESGVEEILAGYGLASPNALVVDPAHAPDDGRARGLSVVASSYESHPVTSGLDRNRMTYFPGARPFELKKPQVRDRVQRLVLASHLSWVERDLSVLDRRRGRIEPDGAPQTYHPIAVAGRYDRPGGEVRIVAFGDSGFASNRHLRTLYNLDLVLNAVHWAVAREPAITLRPKIRSTVQFPLPVASTLTTLYGVGLLVPELLLLAGGLVWLRRRGS